MGLRSIRARLGRAEAGRPESLIILSALPGEGKTTFARDYALAAASAGRRTLLVDGDVYTRSLSLGFGLSGAGLSEVVAGEATLFSAMRKEPRSGLHILGARSASKTADQPMETDGKRLESLLQECCKHFDLIVIDSPAMLPTTGGVPFLTYADRALLIVEWERTDRQAVIQALELLGDTGEKIAGAVLNKVAMPWHRFFDNGMYFNVYNQPANIQPAPVAIRKAS